MGVAPDDILEPTGIIQSEWFPHSSSNPDERAAAFAELAKEWIADGQREAAAATVPAAKLDDFVWHWATYRALSAVYRRLSFNPSSENRLDQGGMSRTNEQIRTFGELAAQHKQAADGLRPIITAGRKRPPPSRSVRNVVEW